ncbi:hypothetical protein V8J88_13565 [Massilia sp. W12]|uniref:hypothetical protein n=1 Tax=Massilia sp. W12 TaxID=3126507 RepID=UPI0030CB2B0E
MKKQITSAVPGHHLLWIIGGLMCGLAGLSVDLILSGAVFGVAAKWGGFGALIGAGVGLMAVASKAKARLTA